MTGPTGERGPTGYIQVLTAEQRTGYTGDFSTGISTTQSTNVVSYNPGNNNTTFRELGLYNEHTPLLPKSGSEDDHRIISNHSIIPKINGLVGNPGLGYSLGNQEAYWNSVYAREIFTTDGTIYVVNPETSEQMTIKYNPVTLRATISNEFATVQSVNTSMITSGQIDANLIPFTGFSFIGKLNPRTYSLVSNSFISQTLFLIYTMSFSLTTSIYTPTMAPTFKTNELFQTLAGAYYIVSGLGETETFNLTFYKLTANTNLADYNRSAEGTVTSLFRESSPQTLALSNNDMIILTVSLEPSDNGPVITFEWTQMQFRIPINGVTTANIVDQSITNTKLGYNSVSYLNLQANAVNTLHIADGSVVYSKISPDAIATQNIQNQAVTLDKVSPEVYDFIVNKYNQTIVELNATKAELVSSNARWEKRFAAIDQYISVMAKTYTIQDGAGVKINYNAQYQSNLDIYTLQVLGKKSNGSIVIGLDALTYNTLSGKVIVYTLQNKTIVELTKTNFSSVEWTATVSMSGIVATNYPLRLDLKNSSNETIKFTYLSLSQYNSLRIL